MKLQGYKQGRSAGLQPGGNAPRSSVSLENQVVVGARELAQCAVKGTSWDKGSDWSQAYPRQYSPSLAAGFPYETGAALLVAFLRP